MTDHLIASLRQSIEDIESVIAFLEGTNETPENLGFVCSALETVQSEIEIL